MDIQNETLRNILGDLDKVTGTLDGGKVAKVVREAIETVKTAVIGLAKVVADEETKVDDLKIKVGLEKAKTVELKKEVEDEKARNEGLVNDIRHHGDELDHHKQRRLKGKIVISSVAEEPETPCC